MQPTQLPLFPTDLDKAERSLELLQAYRTIFIIDDTKTDSYWQLRTEAALFLTHSALRYSPEGIEVRLLSSNKPEHCKNLDDIQNSLSNSRRRTPRDGLRRALSLHSNPTVDTQLHSQLRSYLIDLLTSGLLRGRSIKPLNLIVIGCRAGVITGNFGEVLSKYARRLDKRRCDISQVGVQLVTVGGNEEEMTRMSKLDNELHWEKGVRDMVDTTPYRSNLDRWTLVKILTGGFNRTTDRVGDPFLLD